MIKKVFTSLFLCFVLLFCISINDINVNAINELEELNDVSHCYNSINDSMNINVTLEKDHYLLNEEIIINISYDTLEVEPEISYDSLGFNVVFENISVNGITLKLIYNHLSLTPNLILSINDKNINVYGYVDNSYGIFISKHSEDDAAFRYFKHLYENELITLQELEDFVTKQNSKCARVINEETISSESINNSNVQMLSTETDVVVYGAVKWEDERDIIHHYQFARIDIMDDDVATDDVICTVYTDETGYFWASFPNTTNETENGGYDIFLNIYAESENGKVHVRPDTVSFTYKISTKDMEDPVIYNDYIPNNITDLYFGTIIIKMDTDAGQAMQIAQAATIANKYAEEMTIIDIAPVGVVYPSQDEEGCYYNQPLNLIYICKKNLYYQYSYIDDEGSSQNANMYSYSSWDVIMHEYGHHIADELDLDNYYGAHHYIETNMSDHYYEHYEGVSLCKDCPDETKPLDLEISQTLANYYYYGSRLAWGEGIATYFSLAAQDYFSNILLNIYSVGNSAYESYDLAFLEYDSQNCLSDSCEDTITSILYNMLDENFEPPIDEPKTEEQIRAEENIIGTDNFDKLSIDHDFIFVYLTSSNAYTLSEFVNYLLINNLVDRGLLGRILEYHSVSATNLVANNATLGMYPTFKFEAGGSEYYFNTEHRIKVYDENNELILTINVDEDITSSTQEVEHPLSEEEWNTIISATEGGIFKWQVESRHDYLGENIYYVSSFNEVDISENENVKDLMEGTEQKSFDYSSSTHWYKIEPNTTGSYTFFTSGSLDTYIEVFNNMVCDNSTLGRIEYDDDSQDGLNAKVSININAYETKYIRVTEVEGNHGSYTLNLTAPHNHDYIYVINKNDRNTHIERCTSCDYIKIQAHTVDNSTKQCVFCKALITGGIIGGGSILSLDDEIIYYKEEDEYSETI